MLKNFLFLCAFLLVGACGPTEGGGNDGAAVEVDRSVYPEGPYGSDEGSIVTNHKLLTADGEDFFLGANVRENADNKLMLLSSGAPWCTACIEEQPKLQALYETFHSQGLEIVEVIFQDIDRNPATPEDASEWLDEFDCPFPVLADGESQFDQYQDPSLALDHADRSRHHGHHQKDKRVPSLPLRSPDSK